MVIVRLVGLGMLLFQGILGIAAAFFGIVLLCTVKYGVSESELRVGEDDSFKDIWKTIKKIKYRLAVEIYCYVISAIGIWLFPLFYAHHTILVSIVAVIFIREVLYDPIRFIKEAVVERMFLNQRLKSMKIGS